MLGTGKSSILPTAMGSGAAPIDPTIPMAGGTIKPNLGFLSALGPQGPQSGAVTKEDGKEMTMAERIELAMKQMQQDNQSALPPNVSAMGGPSGEGQQLAQTLSALMRGRGFR